MSDTGPSNAPVLSVSDLSQALKRAVEQGFGYVRVRGEISGFKRAASGHLYFAMKDEKSVLDAVCWRGTAGRLSVAPEDGLEVIISGKLTTYPARSRYQIVVESIEHAGEGALLKLLEERRRKLAAEGLFDEDRKRAIPYLPDVIGVVTSPTGAVVRDILHRIADRFPRHVLVWPVLVQGETAAAQIVNAIDGFNALKPGSTVPRPDLLIVARGGGSLEDLWSFNEEAVVRAAAASEIPLISAVGHETDTTLIDLAADHRAPTPTAAAEMAVPVRADLAAETLALEGRLVGAIARQLETRCARIEGLARGLPEAGMLLGAANQRLDDWAERLGNAVHGRLRDLDRLITRLQAPHPRHTQRLKQSAFLALVERFSLRHPKEEIGRSADALADSGEKLRLSWSRYFEAHRASLQAADRLLESFSYKGVLDRGYAVVRDAGGTPLTSVSAISSGQALELELKDGRTGAVAAGKPAPRAKLSKKLGDDQGTLL
jgi:exodeoxyribonuclease VII large subunit